MGAAAGEPRRRGRPPGSVGKRSRDLKGYLDARYGGSAAQQAAALAMVTPKEVKAAGGDVAKAVVAKAAHLVEHVRHAQDARDERLRQLVREVVVELVDAGAERDAILQATKRIREGSAGFSLAEALKMMAAERAALLPYTDQKQPTAVELKGEGLGPAVVVQHMGAPVAALAPTDVEFVEVFEVAEAQVSPLKSHDEGQATELPGLLPPGAAD